MKHDMLIKLGRQENMKELLHNGAIYMNTLQFFREVEKNAERHDPNEGIERIMQMKNSKLERYDSVSDNWEAIASITGGIGQVRNTNLDKMNIYCMFYFALQLGDNIAIGDIVNSQVRENFGDYAVIVHDAKQFVSKIKEAAQERGLYYECRRVEYIDMSSWHDEVGPFVKDSAFSHQQEIRILVNDDAAEPGPLKLFIGDISGIAQLAPTSCLDNIRFRVDLAKND